MGIYKPDSGCVMLDEGRILNSSHRGLFAYVPQGNMLMSGTIRQILAFYDEQGMSREHDLWAALDIACAKEFVEELPQGLDTPLGEHGAGLSEGQIQRIALARAIFSGHPVLLLDEATSALDEQTEVRVLDNLKAMRNKTVLIVTHRPRACEICDRVIRMDHDGENAGGSHE
jgi:ATP-binding cassette subfamily B protein